ncbi:MAG: transposase [Deltaproteobacteria bacterium]|jgi:IS5 family transposase|nr:transposase [Deltaproteobacteria bacterium]
MKRLTLSDIEYGRRKRTTKRDEFLRIMEQSIPWDEWVAYILPYYPEGKRGRPPMGIEKMLRMYLLQCWFNLSDEGLEDAIYDSYAMRTFMGVNFFEEQVPDATTLLKFRHLLEKHNIGKVFFEAVARALRERGHMMHQTKKGNEWHFGMKCHVGVDAGSGYVHSLETTAANMHDITMAEKLIRADDEVVYGDSGYIGIEKREEVKNSPHLSAIEYRINRRHHSVQRMPKGCIEWEKQIERCKSSVRQAKNTHRLHTLFASTNLLMCARAGRSLRPA